MCIKRERERERERENPSIHYLQDVQNALLADGISISLREMKYVLEDILIEDIHGEYVMSDQTVAYIGGGDRCNSGCQKIRIAVALISGDIANWQR